MPTVTVSGGTYSALVQYTTNDAFSYGNQLGGEIGTRLAAGTLSNADYTTGPVTPGTGSLVTFANGTSSPVTLDPTVAAVVVKAAAAVQIQGAATSVLAGSGGLTYSNMAVQAAGAATVVAGDGANRLTTGLAGGGRFAINTGAGNDVVGVFTGSATVNAATGTNTIVLGGTGSAGNSFVYSEGYDSIVGNTVVGGGGNDTVDVGSGQATINPGSSNFFVYDAHTLNTLTFLAGTGSSTVAAGLGASTVTGGLAGNNLLIGGLSYAGSSITGGGNGDQIFAVGSGAVTARGGSGANVTISGAGGASSLLGGYSAPISLANNSFFAGSGNDTLLAGMGADTLAGGSGRALMVSGGGRDTFSFTNGSSGGAATVSGFKGGDVLQLLGYGLTSDTAAAMTTSAGGSTTLNLSDGTRISLQGVGSLSSTQIKTG